MLEFYNFDQRDCSEHYDKGYDCGEGLEINNSGMKWYYDNKLEMCMPFGYKGCGGNGNKFISKDICGKYDKCPPPADTAYINLECDLGKENVESILCESIPGTRRHYPISVCPSGYECKDYYFFDRCCNITNQQIYWKNTSNKPKCKNGKNPSEYYGKSCEDEFCSKEEECIKLEIFAHCCPK
uniref:BPTI/Kunitz inhibitor domain-containing protein n=1 Tax=Meloidogyne incognita TaxID=6306 RepID=A0A914LRX6_MELIC